MTQTTYESADLQRDYRAILDQAKAGEARLRDSDGATLLVLPEAAVEALRAVASAAANLAAVERVVDLGATRQPDVADYGEWGWLRVFDADDLREFVRELREAIIVCAREGSATLVEEQLRAWRVTAAQAEDPLFRSILLGGASEEDFVAVGRPTSSSGEGIARVGGDGVE